MNKSVKNAFEILHTHLTYYQGFGVSAEKRQTLEILRKPIQLNVLVLPARLVPFIQIA